MVDKEVFEGLNEEIITTHKMNSIVEIVENKFNAGTLFTNASYNDYLKKYSKDELNKYVTVYVVCGVDDYKDDFGEANEKKIVDLKSSIFKNIVILASRLTVNSFVTFSDSRVNQTNYNAYFKDLWGGNKNGK